MFDQLYSYMSASEEAKIARKNGPRDITEVIKDIMGLKYKNLPRVLH
jgi:hypothetical protein